jgi:uncharacterized protein
LGDLYCDGEGVEQDFQQAEKWFNKAAAQGAAEGQDGLGWLALNGSDLQKNAEPALLAYRRALGLSPRRTEWRIEYAQLLRQTGALKDARRELETVLAQEPANRPAQDLLEIVKREMTLAGQ